MPPAKKRKTAAAARAAKAAEAARAKEAAPVVDDDAVQPAATAEESPPDPVEMDQGTDAATATDQMPEPVLPPAAVATEAEPPAPTEDAAAKASERMARFRALQQRAKSSSDSNMKAATAEAQRLTTDPSQLATLRRKHAVASQKLLKAETEDAGEDFERKRAWDWTVEESERWDKRMRKRAAHGDNSGFQDYRSESQKVYKRQLKDMTPDMERYAREKMAAIEKAAANGTLEIVETEDGELLAVDKDGSFYATADSTSFADNKPTKEAVDRLVGNLKKADDLAAKKRRERMAKNGDDGDVTYINEKNKQFNQKLARFYDKYTAEIRDSFERGTMI